MPASSSTGVAARKILLEKGAMDVNMGGLLARDRREVAVEGRSFLQGNKISEIVVDGV
jgi:hypothetical protein